MVKIPPQIYQFPISNTVPENNKVDYRIIYQFSLIINGFRKQKSRFCIEILILK